MPPPPPLLLLVLTLVAVVDGSAHPQHTLHNAALTATFSESRLVSVGSVAVSGDDFELELELPLGSATRTVLTSAAAAPPTVQPGANATFVAFRWSFPEAVIEARYRLTSDVAEGVEKHLSLLPSAGGRHRATTVNNTAFNLTRIAVINSTSLMRSGAPPTSSITASSHYGLGDYAVFHRFDESHGAYLTCQNPYLSADVTSSVTSLSYAPLMIGQADGGFEIDACIIGQTNLTGELLPKPADPIDVGEQLAMIACLREYLAVASSPNTTVKINIAWTENDFQLDIADPGNRTCAAHLLPLA